MASGLLKYPPMYVCAGLAGERMVRMLRRWVLTFCAVGLAGSADAGIFGVPTNLTADGQLTIASVNPPGFFILTGRLDNASGDVEHQIRFFIEVTGPILDLKVFDAGRSSARDDGQANTTTTYQLIRPDNTVQVTASPGLDTPFTDNRLARLNSAGVFVPADTLASTHVVNPGLYELRVTINGGNNSLRQAFGLDIRDGSGNHYNVFTIGQLTGLDSAFIGGAWTTSDSAPPANITQPMALYAHVDRGCTVNASNYHMQTASSTASLVDALGASNTLAMSGTNAVNDVLTVESTASVNQEATNYGLWALTNNIGAQQNIVDWRFADYQGWSAAPGAGPGDPVSPIRMYLPNGYAPAGGNPNAVAPLEPILLAGYRLVSGPNPGQPGTPTRYQLTASLFNAGPGDDLECRPPHPDRGRRRLRGRLGQRRRERRPRRLHGARRRAHHREWRGAVHDRARRGARQRGLDGDPGRPHAFGVRPVRPHGASDRRPRRHRERAVPPRFQLLGVPAYGDRGPPLSARGIRDHPRRPSRPEDRRARPGRGRRKPDLHDPGGERRPLRRSAGRPERHRSRGNHVPVARRARGLDLRHDASRGRNRPDQLHEPELRAAATSTFTLVVRPNPTLAGGTIVSNTATVSSAAVETDPSDNSSTATTTVQVSPDIAVTKSDSPDPVLAGADITYVITVTNNGPSQSGVISLTDTVPANTTFRAVSVPGGWTCPTVPAVGGTGNVACNGPGLAVGASARITLVVRVNAGVAAGTTITNSAVGSTAGDPVAGNNTGTTTTTVAAALDRAPLRHRPRRSRAGRWPGSSIPTIPAPRPPPPARPRSRWGRASAPPPRSAAGDLLLVIQMQDAAIDSTNDRRLRRREWRAGTWPSGSTNLNNAGRFEYVMATNTVGAAGGVVNLASALANTYTNAAASATQGQRRFQVVRIPQYATATLSSTLSATPWNGTAGGILAFDVAGNLALGAATVSVNGLGFRGGQARQLTGGPGGTGTDYRNLATNAFHGSKGEGIAGTPRYVWSAIAGAVDTGVEGYPNGQLRSRGAGQRRGRRHRLQPHGQRLRTPAGEAEATAGAGGRGGNAWDSQAQVGGFGGAAFTVAAGNRRGAGRGRRRGHAATTRRAWRAAGARAAASS